MMPSISDNFKAWWNREGEAHVMGFITEQETTPSLSVESVRALAAFCYDSALYAVFHGEIGPRNISKFLDMPAPSFHSIERESKPFDPPTGALPIGDRS